MILVNYHTRFLPYRRRLVTLDLIHDERGRSWKIEDWEIMSVERFHWNGNLKVCLIVEGSRRTGYIDANDPWQVECYSPQGELIHVITADNVDETGHVTQR